MAHEVNVHDTLRKTIHDRTDRIQNQQEAGVVNPYAELVHNLFKNMEPADELMHASAGLSGEAGEILDATKKVWAYGKPLDVEHVLEELGDLRFYYQAWMNMLGLTDADVQAHNIEKLMQRYPEGVYRDKDAIARADKAQDVDIELPGSE